MVGEGTRLTATWTWAPALLSARKRCASWRRAGSGRWKRWCATPRSPAPAAAARATLPLVALSQAEIERLERRYPQLEDILPLSPLQEGLLFHALYDAQAPDVYTVQLALSICTARSTATALQAAAQALLARHASLRAGFLHDSLEPAGADHRAARGAARGAGSTCRRAMTAEREERAGRDPGGRSAPSASISPRRRCALHADPARRRRAPAGAHQPSYPAGRLVGAGAGAGVARALCAQGRRRARCRG